MSALMSDLIAGHLSPQVANAVCTAGGRLLKVVEMQHKYASTNPMMSDKKVPDLTLTGIPNGRSEANN